MILDTIVAHKRKEVAAAKEREAIETLQAKCETIKGAQVKHVSFAASLRKTGAVSLIAEVKKASPSKGLIRPDFDPAEIAREYDRAGAAAISVLTDTEFFQGSPDYLAQVRQVTDKPVLRKDFIIDSYQIYEAKILGANAILLIMAVLSNLEVTRLLAIAVELGLECLVEVHTAAELARAKVLGAGIIGINNRDLNTFQTDLETTFRLREMIIEPDITVVSESGINSRADVEKLYRNGIHAMLVGEALMREKDICKKISELLGPQQEPERGTA